MSARRKNIVHKKPASLTCADDDDDGDEEQVVRKKPADYDEDEEHVVRKKPATAMKAMKVLVKAKVKEDSRKNYYSRIYHRCRTEMLKKGRNAEAAKAEARKEALKACEAKFC